ncbi:MAG: spore germination protein [Ruminococcus sp.]|nr:spore germination protein [Ruminococcus sp.]
MSEQSNTSYQDKPIPASLEENIAIIRHLSQNSSDVLVNRIIIGEIPCALLCCEGMVGMSFISQLIIEPLTEIPPMPDSDALFDHIRNRLMLSVDRPVVYNYGELFRTLNSGFAVLIAQGQTKAFAFGAQGYDRRSVGEPSGEANVLGARDGFVEVIRPNMSLLRRRMKSPYLKLELINIGTVSRTDICLCYLHDRVPEKLLRQIKELVNSTELETILSTGYLQPFLENRRGNLFDSVSLTERPDVLCAKMLEGRVGILIDGTPFALVVPKLFVESFQALDDYNFKPYYATLIRWLKYGAFLIAMLLPALYIAVSMHHPELLNSTLLMILSEAEAQAPLSLVTEAIGVLLMYEIVREAGLRLPKAVGGAVSIVAGLIIGDAAVSSGLISTPMLTMVAISVIAGYVIPDLNQAVTILRLAFILCGGLWGLYGVALLGMAVLFNLCATESFGYPLTAPLSPMHAKGLRDVATRVNFRRLQKGHFTVEEYHE